MSNVQPALAEKLSAPSYDPAMPSLSLEDAAALVRSWGVDHVKPRTLKAAIYRRDLRRFLVGARVRLSEDDLRAWLYSTADEPILPHGRQAEA